MNVAIIEDEPFAANRLERLLEQVCVNTKVDRKIDSVDKAIRYFNAEKPPLDLIFMDIELADGECFEIFKHSTLDIPIIFTTAYDHYAIKAFDHNSVHYLLKPVEVEDIARAMSKYQNLTHQLRNLELLSNQLHIKKTQYKEHFLGKIGDKLVHKAMDQVAYFFSEDKLVSFVDETKRKYFLEYNLDELANNLLQPDQFFRVSRKYIVNLSYISTLMKHPGQRLKLLLSIDQEHEIVVSKERVAEFKKWINH